jgi:MEKHLA domain
MMTSRKAWWIEPPMVHWCQVLLDSFRRWAGRDLMERVGSREDQARALFGAPFAVVSHGTEQDPILNYGNRVALDLWETSWEQFSSTPSRLTAEPATQAERERMLARASTQGFIDDYRGVRVSAKGRRFLVERAFVWNVVGQDQRLHGQAATFSHWTFL